MEIERKYLLKKLPDGLDRYPSLDIEQHYLCTSPTVRIRRLGDSYILTVKEHLASTSSAIHNREEEFALSREAFLSLKDKCDYPGVEKRRYRIPLRSSEKDGLYAGLVAELDLFVGRHRGLALVEVEFPDTASADAFLPPSWFGEDVSLDPRYRNSYLASH